MMDDSNFDFLIDQHPRIYSYCKMMDYLIYIGEFNHSVFYSKKAVEGMVIIADKHINPTNFIDYSITPGKTFRDHVENLYKHALCNEDIKRLIIKIRKLGAQSVHSPFRYFKREELDQIAEDTHKILKYLYNEINPFLSIHSQYSRITGNESWIKEIDENYFEIIELNQKIIKKEKENIKIKLEISDLL